MVHFLSGFSSSDVGPVQSRVAPPLDDSGTGCTGIDAVEGLKSISEAALRLVAGGGFVGISGTTGSIDNGAVTSTDAGAFDNASFGGDTGASRPCKRASRRALSLSACCTSCNILGSIMWKAILLKFVCF